MPEFDVKAFLHQVATCPGVYQMFDSADVILYVGKAKNLKNRLKSYFTRTSNNRIQSLVKQIQAIKVIITKTENDALLLENNLIKKLKPRYNILFRDDKSYPYIYLSTNTDFPRLDFHRGAKTKKGKYYGPYPSSGAVRESLSLLQKLFKVRQCSDVFFRHRTRPCLQYQIKRCSAPCVDLITANAYQQNIRLAQLFLEGKNQQLITALMQRMATAAENLAFEEAAQYRDQIKKLRQVQQRQYITQDGDDIDVVAVLIQARSACVEILLFRQGRLIGNRAYFPSIPDNATDSDVLAAFLPQYYLDPKHRPDIPKQILITAHLDETFWLENVLSEQSGHKVKIQRPSRGPKLHWLAMANSNAKNALKTHLADRANFYHRLEVLQEELNLDSMPQRIECFDISHSSGEATVASCVVFDTNGAARSAYRRFNITAIKAGDDYAAMYQAIQRRYTKLKTAEEGLPDLILIDGGKGQLHQAEKALEEIQLSGTIVLAIAKGPGRKPGLETIFRAHQVAPIQLPPDSLALHVLQQIRDEAHRFAVSGHRKRRDKRRRTSPLEQIKGIGAKRRQMLLHYFGGLQEILAASQEQLANVPGISYLLAKQIFVHLHGHDDN